MDIVLFAIAALIFLIAGYFLGLRQSKSQLAQREMELQAQWDSERRNNQIEQQSTQQTLALAQQQLQQQENQLAEQKDNFLLLKKDWDVQNASFNQMGADYKALQATEKSLLDKLAERDQRLGKIQTEIDELRQSLQREQNLIREQKELLGQATEQKIQLDTSRRQLQDKENVLSALTDELNRASNTITELETTRQKDIEALTNERRQLEENRLVFKQEFENLANKIFETKHVQFSEQSKVGLDALLLPFKEQLEAFRKRADEVHTHNVEGHASLKSELDKLRELNQQITTEASNLTKALKGDKKIQGSWGEQKVELLLEQSGLRKGIEYERERNFKDEEGSNRRPDFVVHLPDNKHIIIDSKVSLIDYSNYIAAETDEIRQLALVAHVDALRNHVNSLSGKNYPELNGMNSPDFVFLFMPIEPAYLLAAEYSPAIFQEAYEKRIAIVTATTLLPVLRVVSNLWTIQRQNQYTRELAEQAGRVYEKLRIFVEKMERLGNQITTVQRTYKESFDTLKDGHGSLTKTVSKFVDLGVKVTKKLPASVVGDDLPDLIDSPENVHSSSAD